MTSARGGDARSFLVTGGAGFIGSHLVRRILQRGLGPVRVLDDFSTGRRDNLSGLEDEIELIEGSITDRATCRDACADVDIVLHQAALPSVARSVADPLGTHAVNATGTLNMLVASRGAGVGRFVYASSSSAYGDTEVLPKHEELPTDPRSPYAVAKLTGEQYCRAFAGVHGMETVSLRYFNVFGARQPPDSPYSAVIPIFVRHALEGRSPTIDGDGLQTRDFTHVSNVVDANLKAAAAPAAQVMGRVYNVGCGERTSVLELWGMIRAAVDTDVEATHGPPRPGDVRDSLADLGRARRDLGYEVRVALEDGIRETVEWYAALREGARA